METIVKKIYKGYLKLNNWNNGKTYHVTGKGSELFWATDENGETVKFTRNEVKNLGGNLDKIEEVLELQKLANYDLGIFSEDGYNFITFNELKKWEKLGIDTSEVKKVEFRVVEG